MLREWTLSKLEPVRECSRILLRDSLRLLPEVDGGIHSFAQKNGFTVIVAATNLVFRELYEKAIADPETKKLLVIDRVPFRRRTTASVMKAPPPFYPDLLTDTPDEACIDLDLRQFLMETTGDPNWPTEVNDPLYARLIVRNLGGILRAHQNLRKAHPGRFTDFDFKTIVAFAALGVADSAFKKLNAEDYWKIGLMAHDALQELEALAPEVTKPIIEELSAAKAPFCWFSDHDADTVIRAFYLSVILAQHTEHWNLLLPHIDPALSNLTNIELEILTDATPKLVALDPIQAQKDLKAVEKSLSRDNLDFLLLERMHLTEPAGFAGVIEQERYSTLFLSLAILVALDKVLSHDPAEREHERILKVLSLDGHEDQASFAQARQSVTLSHLKEGYTLASDIYTLRNKLAKEVKILKVMKIEDLSFKAFRQLWNENRINRLEYYLSAFERLVQSGKFLPRPEDELPDVFSSALQRIRQKARDITEDVNQQLDELNSRFQEMVAVKYPSWIVKDGEVRLTSQFLRRVLKPHWDPSNEKAVVLIFDGMRYDIWDELLRPMFEERLEIIGDYPACSLLPSETHITRKAISAGTYPDEFDTRSSEDKLLKEGLSREFGYTGDVEVVTPEGAGVGETVRYRADNLDVYIFELCDKELHNIRIKKLPDGRQVAARPLSFIYQQHLKNIIDTEVMAIIRNLQPGTKVFVTADHGFGKVPRERIRVDSSWLNEPADCSYLNAPLRQSLTDVKSSEKVRRRVWEFPVSTVRLSASEKAYDRKTKQSWHKDYSTIIFPKTGYALSRPGSRFTPDAFSHGGISIQELMIPMVVLRVKQRDSLLLGLDKIVGPIEVVEGEEIEFRLRLKRTTSEGPKIDELRVDVEAAYSRAPDLHPLPHQVYYVPVQGVEVVYRFRPDPADATVEERRNGTMKRTLAITVSYREGRKIRRNSRTHCFAVRLNSEQVVRRVPAHLGNILGLRPKSMR